MERVEKFETVLIHSDVTDRGNSTGTDELVGTILVEVKNLELMFSQILMQLSAR